MIAPGTPAGKRVMAIAAAELEIRRRAAQKERAASVGRIVDLSLADFIPAVRGPGYERPEHLAPLTDFFDRVSRGEVVRMLCSAPPQFGKALADDTPIWTQRGWISVGEVVVGDMLVGSDGQWTRVNGVFPQGEVDLYDVAFVGGTVVRACGEHRWAVRGRYSNRRYVKTTVEIAADLTEKDGRHKWRVPIVAPAAGTPCELPIDPYVLGAWLGDGTSRAAALTSADEEIVEAFRAAGYPTSRVHTRGAAKTYSFLGGLRVKLRELGVLGPGLKHIPERYLTAPPEARLALLQGIADTDGTAAKNGRSQSICTTSERLARDYKTLISSLGGFWREYTRPAAGKTAHNIYVRLPKGMSLFRLGRKANRVLPTERFDHRGRLIADVLPAGRGTATCFSVAAKDHLFCAGADLVVTHNSVVMSTGCARYVARQPDRPIIYATYGASLAEQKSREARDIAVECGVELRGDASSVDEWLTPQGGGMRARGVGGPTIGHPAKCFIGATRVQTPQGVKTIADVARGTGRTLVLSFDHAQGRPVWRSVLASQRSVSRSLVEIETVGGKRLRCTSDHPIFVLGRGYVPAGELRSNDLLRTANLRGVLPAGVEGGHSLPGLFPRPQALRGVCSLHVVRREDLQAKLRAREGETQRHPVGVLLSGVHGQALSGNDGCSMQGVRDIGTAALEQEVLFERLPDAGSASGEDQAVRGVRSEFSSSECSQSVLREEVRVGGAFEADARRGQFTFQDRGQLREAVPRDASARVGTGRESVRGVREAGEPLRGDPARPTNLSVDSIGASHRSRPEEQRAREPRHAVQDVPRGSPQVGVDSVAMVRELRGESDEVFDIEVEGTHNFFAEGLLVHNCFIVDDPHKDREEAESALLRQKTFDWYVAVAESRCHPDSSILVAHSRWHDDDLIGRLKELQKPDGTPLFEYYNLPAILPSGEPLWYQRPLDWLAPKQQFEHDWWSLWMGAPRKRGERVLRGLRYYEPGELPGHYRIGKGVDLGGYTSKRSTHHSVAVVVLENLDDPPNARRKYVVDVQRVKEEVPVFAKRLRDSAWPGAWRFDASAQERGIAQLFRDMGIDVDDYLATTDKLQRAQLLIAEWNAGRVLLPEKAPWLREFADELLSFTGANDKADDQVDAAASAIENLRYDGGGHSPVAGSGSRWGTPDGESPRGFG